MLFGPHHTADMRHKQAAQLSSMSDFDQLTRRQPVSRDLAELSGSDPRTAELSARRSLTTGAVMDFVIGVDLAMPATQQLVFRYFRNNQIPIVVLAPAPVAGHIAPAVYGRIAGTQMSKGRHILALQCGTTAWFSDRPWPQLMQDDRICRIQYDRCTCGLQDTGSVD